MISFGLSEPSKTSLKAHVTLPRAFQQHDFVSQHKQSKVSQPYQRTVTNQPPTTQLPPLRISPPWPTSYAHLASPTSTSNSIRPPSPHRFFGTHANMVFYYRRKTSVWLKRENCFYSVCEVTLFFTYWTSLIRKKPSSRGQARQRCRTALPPLEAVPCARDPEIFLEYDWFETSSLFFILSRLTARVCVRVAPPETNAFVVILWSGHLSTVQLQNKMNNEYVFYRVIKVLCFRNVYQL